MRLDQKEHPKTVRPNTKQPIRPDPERGQSRQIEIEREKQRPDPISLNIIWPQSDPLKGEENSRARKI